MVERYVRNTLEDTFLSYDCKNYSIENQISTICYEDDALLILEGIQMINHICKKLSIEPIVKIAQNHAEYFKFVSLLFEKIEVMSVDYHAEIEFHSVNAKNDETYSLATINPTYGKIYFKMPGLVSLAQMPAQSLAESKKYYVYSNETDMLYEKFVIANKIRKNGALAFFDTTNRTKEEIISSFAEDKNTYWILVRVNRELFELKRCLIYHVKMGEGQMEGNLYYKNIGRKSIVYPSMNKSDEE